MLLVSGFANADVINFDDLIDSQAPIQNGYQGLQWTNFSYVDGTLQYPGSGYDVGTVSETNVAYNGFGDAAAVSDGEFSFCSAYLTAAWDPVLEVTVEGWKEGSQKYSETVVVDNTAPAQFQFGFNDIDELRFSTDLNQFALDDMEIEYQSSCITAPIAPIPTLSQWSLLVMAMLFTLLGITALRRRI
jgi:hypothetical protein